jgi:hypothetical protein
MSKRNPNKVERVGSYTIMNQLMASLEDDRSKVAILCGVEDLNLLVDALSIGISEGLLRDKETKAIEFRDSLLQLKRETKL